MEVLPAWLGANRLLKLLNQVGVWVDVVGRGGEQGSSRHRLRESGGVGGQQGEALGLAAAPPAPACLRSALCACTVRALA